MDTNDKPENQMNPTPNTRVLTKTGTPKTVHVESDFDGDTVTWNVIDDNERILSRHWSRVDALRWIGAHPELQWFSHQSFDVRVSRAAAEAIMSDPCHSPLNARDAVQHAIDRRQANNGTCLRLERLRAELTALICNHDDDCVRLEAERIHNLGENPPADPE